jgi:hypothetical protein
MAPLPCCLIPYVAFLPHTLSIVDLQTATVMVIFIIAYLSLLLLLL